MLGVHYILYFRMIAYKYTKNGLLLGLFPFGKKKSKSFIMLLVLIILTIYRDKFEKKISSSYEPSKLHFGRAILTPLVYVSFTLMMILEQSMGSFLVATLFQLGYFYFYYDEAILLLMGTRASED